MKLKVNLSTFLLCALLGQFFCTSCLVKHPEYASYDVVMALEPGMTYEALADSLGIKPNYVKEDVLNGFKVYVYKYRLCEIRRFPIIMKRNTGFETEGDFVDLLVTVNPAGEVVHLETCTDCAPSDENTTIVDFDSIVRGITTMVTVTLPAFLVFLSNG